MAITRAQQVKQMLQDGGRIGLQGGGADAGTRSFAESQGRSKAEVDKLGRDFGFSGRDVAGDSGRQRSQASIERDRQAAIEREKFKRAERAKKQALELNKSFLDRMRDKLRSDYVRRTKASNLKDLGVFGKISKAPGILGGFIDAVTVPEETDMFDIDSIREIASTKKAGLSDFESDTLGDLREDIEMKNALEKGNVSFDEFQDYLNRNKPPEDIGGEGGQPIIPIIPQVASAPTVDPVDDPNSLAFLIANTPRYRVMAADGGMMDSPVGGIMDLESARQMYGLGKLVKKATRAVKKIVKSPIGKAALLYTGAGALGNLAGGSGLAGAFKGFTSPRTFLGGVGNIFKSGGLKNIFLGGEKLLGNPAKNNLVPFSGLLGKGGELSLGKTFTFASILPLLGLGTGDETEEQAKAILDNSGIPPELLNAPRYRVRASNGGSIEAGAVMSKEEMEKLAKSPLYKGFKKMYNVDPNMAKGNESYKDKFSTFEQLIKKGYQKGGDVEPVAKKTMPLLDMDGKEMDLREEGGFVPIGRMEKADDVPARLSKNEFVFTADAVRNAGDGDVDKGAEVMYNMMKNLEAGGDVSKESQGLEGARRMFETSQRLEEVL